MINAKLKAEKRLTELYHYLISHRTLKAVQQINACTVLILSFRTDMSGQTVQTQIRLLLVEQSDQGLHCLLYHLHLFEENP